MASLAYQNQLAQKEQNWRELFNGLTLPELTVFPSSETHYRMRAEFRIWHDGDDICYAMFAPGEKAGSSGLIRLENFPPAHIAINNLMPKLLAAVRENPILKSRLFQCEFLATTQSEVLVTLIYHRKLDDDWQEAAQRLSEKLGIHIIGRSRGQKRILSQDFVTEKLTVNSRNFVYRQIEGGFTQPNAEICAKMLEWATQCAQGLDGDLLELYCGNGNFTLPLSQCFHRVLATEVSKTSIQAAQWNVAANNINNIKFARLSAEEFTEAWQGVREFKRLKEQQIDLADYHFSTVFVDPPRAGVDDQTLALLAHFDHIIYISCNPHTLADNVRKLSATHEIRRAALFDQFPFTPHVESGVLLRRKTFSR